AGNPPGASSCRRPARRLRRRLPPPLPRRKPTQPRLRAPWFCRAACRRPTSTDSCPSTNTLTLLFWSWLRPYGSITHLGRWRHRIDDASNRRRLRIDGASRIATQGIVPCGVVLKPLAPEE